MTASRSFILVAVILLLWNLMGVMAFVIQYGLDPAQLAKTDPYTARIFAAMPDWAWTAYAIAVGSGTLGAIMLLLRRAMAAPLFLLSIIAVAVQFGYSFLGTDLWVAKGPSVVLFPAFICIIAVAQFLYARHQIAKGVLR